MVDATRLRQILTNLVSNAIKFSSRGDVTIKTTCEDDELIISVKDTGPGIPPQKLEEIFNVFHQGDDSSTRKYGGTGLGLAISKEFAELLGGTLSVFSSIDASNHGSEFIVSVPASQDARDTQNAIPTANELDENELVTRRQSLNMLVAEDNLVNQMLISKLLAKAGYKYQIVSNGAEALHCKNLSEFDAILMDCQMPEMDGYDATREIRAHHASSSELPIIALTANALPGDRERALDSGMDDFLTKPIDRKKLYKTLDHWAFKGSSSTH
jgi:CheY-like chemotaxis protein